MVWAPRRLVAAPLAGLTPYPRLTRFATVMRSPCPRMRPGGLVSWRPVWDAVSADVKPRSDTKPLLPGAQLLPMSHLWTPLASFARQSWWSVHRGSPRCRLRKRNDIASTPGDNVHGNPMYAHGNTPSPESPASDWSMYFPYGTCHCGVTLFPGWKTEREISRMRECPDGCGATLEWVVNQSLHA